MNLIMKKALIAAAAVAAFGTFTAAAGAEQVNGISVSDSVLGQGSEFTLEISVPPAENADTASVKAVFDEQAFEVLEWKPVISGGFANAQNGRIALSAANVERVIDLSEGLTLTAKMRVKDDAPEGDYVFELNKHSFSYVLEDGFTFEEVWQPEITNVTVTVGALSRTEASKEQTAAAAAVTEQTETTPPVTVPAETEITEAETSADQTIAVTEQNAAVNSPDSGINTVAVAIVAVLAVAVVAILAAVIVLILKKPRK